MEIKLMSKEKPQMGFTTKVILLGLLVLLLLIPLEMVKHTILERQQTGKEAMKSIEQQWGKSQIIGGPVLNIPYTVKSGDQKEQKEVFVAHFLPTVLKINSEISPEIRYRSIYKTVVYSSKVNLQGTFETPDFSKFSPANILWQDAYITVGVTDNRGIRDEVNLTINQNKLNIEPGLKDTDLFKTGISANLHLKNPESLTFNVNLQLLGSQSIQFVPLGKTTNVSIKSTWKDPNFTGNFLPVNRDINSDGFDAQWTVTDLNRNYPQKWANNKYNVDTSAFGVELFMPVDHYQKSYRSAKYGLLFILLTFLVFIFTEITTEKKIHFFHYLLVAVALILFFSLLTALSEQLGFNGSYLIASLATILLITLFTKSIISIRKVVIEVLMVLSVLYTFMFVLLQMKEWAYLAGNIGLFILLAIIMWISGKVKLPSTLGSSSLNPVSTP